MDQRLKCKKPTNPRRNANIFSILTFAYTFPLFAKGRCKSLDEEDIPDVLDCQESQILGDKLESYWKEESSTDKPSLWRSIRRAFGVEFMLLGVGLCFDEIVLRMLRPLALVQLIKYFSPDNDYIISRNEAFTCGAIIVGTSFLSTFINKFATNSLQLLGMKIRVACGSLIYRKCLKLSKPALGGMTIGHITNLLANDLNRFDNSALMAHFIWITPLQVVLTGFLMYIMTGIASTVGIFFMALLVPLQVFVGKKCSKFRLKTALRTDERIRMISEIVSGIKVIKMYTWEMPFTKLISNIRRLEAREIRSINYLRGFMKFLLVTPKIAIFFAVMLLFLTGKSITAVYVYIVTSLYDNLKLSLTVNFIFGMAHKSETDVSIKRIQDLLQLEEINHNNVQFQQFFKKGNRDKPLVELKDVKAKWFKNSPNFALNGVTLRVEGTDQLIGIIGPVGGGKSSIFHAILDELAVECGSINVRGKLSYASQEAWVFTGNIRQNILFGKPMDNNRYLEVLKICSLDHDIALLPYGDQTMVGERGLVLSGGQRTRVNLARALYTDADIYLLDDPFSAVDIHVGKHLFEECIKKFLRNKCTILVTHQLQYLNSFNCTYLVESGKITASGTDTKLNSYKQSVLHDLQVTDEVHSQSCDIDTNLTKYGSSRHLDDQKPSHIREHRDTGKISKKVVLSYINAGGSLLTCISIAIVFIISQVTFTASDYFVAFWVNEKQKNPIHNDTSSLSESTCSYIYSGLVIIMTFTTIFRSYLFFKFCTQISIGLHDKMFKAVINASMQFFYFNNSGRILNRFTKDMGIIDESMPLVLIEMLQIFFTCLGIFVVICITSPYLIIGTAVVSIIFYFIRGFYITTGRSLKRLEATARSPIYGYINETLQGLTTIRASNSQLVLQQEFDKQQDLHSAVYAYVSACSKALSLYIDLVCVLYIAAITFTMLLGDAEQLAGIVGLAITQGVSLLGSLQWGVIQLSELDTQMTSVERVVEYTSMNLEDTRAINKPPSTWPENGAIKLRSVSLRYNPEAPYVLKKLDLNIEAKQKIGIVGRTGVGKSSLITALFQLCDTEGVILVDNINITKIPLHCIRSKISIIPQDPVLFYGTVRSNLDPFGIYTDIDLWNAVGEVELKTVISLLDQGLDHSVSDGGSNFSVGQRQLICLARAILRKNRILVMDEATANVDSYTDLLIQNTVNRKFSECTVLTVAHRLNTIIDCDKVLVLDSGRVVEYDHPHVLLQNKSGIFYSMVQKSGPTVATSLSMQAEHNHRLKIVQVAKDS